MTIPLEIIMRILRYINPKSYIYTNRYITHDAVKKLRRMFILKQYPTNVIKALGGVRKCLQSYTIINSTPEFTGITSYIDQVRIDHPLIPRTGNVFLGVDCYNRPFVILRYWCKTNGTTRELAATMFQRYSANSRNTWCFGTYYDYNLLPGRFSGEICISQEALNRVERMLAGEKIVMPNINPKIILWI